MPFWSNQKPNVNDSEFQKIRGELSGYGFHKKDLDFVEQHFRGDMHETAPNDAGIQEEEINDAVDWLKKNSSKHPLSEQKINTLEGVLKKRL